MFVPVNKPLFSNKEIQYLEQCITSGWISSEGPFVKKLEDQFSEVINRKFGIAVANGTGALEIAIKALGIDRGDEIIMPTFTIISCASAVVRAGAKPVLVDCDAQTWNMDVNQIEDKITSNTKAIMAVHIYGLAVDMDPLLAIAKKYDLAVLEDAAEAIGLNYKGKPCGSFGDISTFSFYPNKLVTTGEGGLIATNSEEIAESCRAYRNLCFGRNSRFIHEQLGWNYRMSNLQAAVGVAQLEKLEKHLRIKLHIAYKYIEGLDGIQQIELPIQSTTYSNNVYWIFGIVVKESENRTIDEITSILLKHGVQTRPFFWPMHLQPVFNNKVFNILGEFPISERLAKRGFYIPSGLGLSDKEIDYVIDKIRKVFI